MMICNKLARLETYQLKIESIDLQHEEIQMIKGKKPRLLSMENPRDDDLIRKH